MAHWTGRTLAFAIDRAERLGIIMVAAGALFLGAGVFITVSNAESSPDPVSEAVSAGSPSATPAEGSAPPQSNLEPTATATATSVPAEPSPSATATVLQVEPAATPVPATATPLPPTPVPPSPTAVQPTAAPPTPTPVPPTPVPPTPAPPPPQSVNLHPLAQQMLGLHNQARAAAGLPPLQVDPTLVTVAQIRADDMAANNYFSHTSPTGATAFSILGDYGYGYYIAGENIARNNYPEDEAASVSFQGFMNSPGHRANILHTDFSHVGIAYKVAANGMRYFAVVFAGF